MRTTALMSMMILVTACSGDNTRSPVDTPGAETSAKTQALEAGAAMLQEEAPLRAFNAYLDGFHFASGDQKMQMEAHHYCGHLNEDVIQCALFDGNGGSARLIGVEYIVSSAVFAKLPAEEKHLWHSHVHEVQAGQLIAPGIPLVAEHELMEKIAHTYGKTWHTWHTNEGQTLPLGAPMLMMGFTKDGQLDEARVADRDSRFDVSSAEKRENRKDITYPVIDTDADAWQKGIVLQTELRKVPMR